MVFLHRILPGGADRSYGVHVAQLAGLPKPVVLRAQEILSELESSPNGRAPRRRAEEKAQLALFTQRDGLAEEIKSLDIDSMTPLQAMTKLYELVERARAQG